MAGRGKRVRTHASELAITTYFFSSKYIARVTYLHAHIRLALLLQQRVPARYWRIVLHQVATLRLPREIPLLHEVLDDGLAVLHAAAVG